MPGNPAEKEGDDGLQPLTRLLNGAAAGEAGAIDQLLPLVYDTLKEIARRRMALERPDHTLQTTALVNECYLRLFANAPLRFAARAQFFYLAADAIRRILVEHARGRARQKRGGKRRRVPPNVLELAASPEPADVLDFDDALERLDKESPRAAAVVRLRFFAGVTAEEAAEALGISLRSVHREWAYARAWLYDALKEPEG